MTRKIINDGSAKRGSHSNKKAPEGFYDTFAAVQKELSDIDDGTISKQKYQTAKNTIRIQRTITRLEPATEAPAETTPNPNDGPLERIPIHQSYSGVNTEIEYFSNPYAVRIKPKPTNNRRIRSFICRFDSRYKGVTFKVKEYMQREDSSLQSTTRTRFKDLYRAAEWLTETRSGQNQLHIVEQALRANQKSIETHIGESLNLD